MAIEIDFSLTVLRLFNFITIHRISIIHFLVSHASAGMPLMISNPIHLEETDFTKSNGSRRMTRTSKVDWTFEEDTRTEDTTPLNVISTPVAPLTSPIIEVNSSDNETEGITITHECDL